MTEEQANKMPRGLALGHYKAAASAALREKRIHVVLAAGRARELAALSSQHDPASVWRRLPRQE